MPSDFHVLITEPISIARKHAPRNKKYLRDRTAGHVRVLPEFLPLFPFAFTLNPITCSFSLTIFAAFDTNGVYAFSFSLPGPHLFSFYSFSLFLALSSRFSALSTIFFSFHFDFYFPLSRLPLFRSCSLLSPIPIFFLYPFISTLSSTPTPHLFICFLTHTHIHTHIFSLYPYSSSFSCWSHISLSFVHVKTLSLSFGVFLHFDRNFFLFPTRFCTLFLRVSSPIAAEFFFEEAFLCDVRFVDKDDNFRRSQAARHKETSRGDFKVMIFLAFDISSICFHLLFNL